MMGRDGLTLATKVAILNANYIARRLQEGGHYELLYAGQHGLVAHECIIDTRPFKASAGVDVEDIAKRLIDYRVHPPTGSFPLAGGPVGEAAPRGAEEEGGRLFCPPIPVPRGKPPAQRRGARPADKPLSTP